MKSVGNKGRLLASGLSALICSSAALASSHREAPLAAMNAESDLTDVYIFRSPANPNNVVMIMGVWPFSDSSGAPNYTQFGYDTIYQFNIDNDGDSKADITWEYAFNVVNGKNIMDPTVGPAGVFSDKDTFLYNTAPITISSGNGSWNIEQVANVRKVHHPSAVLHPEDPSAPVTVEYDEGNRLVGPEFVGPHSNPNGYTGYESLITHTVNGEKHYFGPRDDPFWVDLPGIFDLIGLRGLQNAPKPAFVDSVKGWNFMAIALEVPIDNVVTAAPGACTGNAPPANICTVGFWGTTYQAEFDTGLKIKKSVSGSRFKQISRLGMPLFNEVVVPLSLKDAYNTALTPDTDIVQLAQARALNRAFKPELATLFGPAAPAVPNTALKLLPQIPTGNLQDPPFTAGAGLEVFSTVRCDIVRIFTTGIPGVNGRTDGWKLPGGLCGEVNAGGITAGEMLRVNLSIAVTPGDINQQNRLGLIGVHETAADADNIDGDLDGFPNGRRLGDDVVDIELQVVAGVLANEFGDNSCPGCSGTPYDILSDSALLPPTSGLNLDRNDKPFLNVFPYLAQPHQGYNHDHQHNGFGASFVGIAIGLQSIALVVLCVMLFRRPKRVRTAA